MATFVDRFGGSPINPAQVSYRAVALSADMILQWPEFATDTNVIAGTMEVTASVAGRTLFMPNATLAAPGETTIWYNSGSLAFTVATMDGTPIATIEPGGRRLIELTSNTTVGGTWVTTLLGVGVGSLDVAGAAGAGLRAIGTTLNIAFPVETVGSSRAITAADRAKVLVWTGGAGTLTMPSSVDVPDMVLEIRNQGTGALTIAMTGGEQIDAVSSLTFNNAESAFIHADTGAWYTVGRGRNAQFNFTQLQKTVTGGTVALSLTEAANVVQTYNGVLTSNVDIVLPSVVQVYYVSNQTTGAFSMRFKNAGVGALFSLPQGQNAVIFSDGTNVINASTTTAGTVSLFGAGTVGAPSVAIGTSNNGFYSPSGGQVAFATGGIQILTMTAAGAQVSIAGNAAIGVQSTGANAAVNISRPAGAQGFTQFLTVNSPRWLSGVDNAAESGANAGSNYGIQRYADAGTFIDTPVSINRATGLVTVTTGVRDLSTIGEIKFFASDAITKTGYIKLNGALLSRTVYADLWAYAQTTTPVSEATWNAGFQGRFSVGDGSTTFRVPDVRGTVIRALDDGRGIDSGRTWGSYQDSQNLSHNHGTSDPGHNHGINDPGHAHSVADPGHVHGVGDPGHAHTAFGTTVGNGGTAATGFPWNQWNSTNSAVSASGTGVFIGASGTGIGIFGAGTGIFNSAAVTNLSIVANGGAETRVRSYAYPAYMRY